LRSRISAALAPALIIGSLTTVGITTIAPVVSAAAPCPVGTTNVPITWGAGKAVNWPRNSTSASATNIAGSGLNLNLALADPTNRNGDDTNPLQDLGEANANGTLFGWDPRTYTETDGAFGAGYLTIEMNSLNIGDALTFTFDFNHPVLLPDFSVGDIDYAGLGFSPPEEPWNSFQDEVTFTADREGLPVGVTLAALGGARPVIKSGAAVGGPYTLNANGDVNPDDAAGTLRGATNEPVTTFRLKYANGPDDIAAEAGPSYPSPAILPKPANSVSDSHAVRLNFFTACLGTGSIGDTIFTDIDGDGVQDPGELGIAGVKVDLLDPQGNIILSTTTDAQGKYLFPQLPAFNWTVRVDPATLPAGYTQTGDPDATKDNRTTVNLAPGQTVLTADFGYQPPLGTISGTVFSDRNDNGVLNPPDDGGIGGTTITLSGKDLAGNTISRTTQTAPDGTYSFPNVPAGTYTVTETQPAGYGDGKDTPGAFGTGAGNDALTVTLPPGGSSPGNNFAELATASIAGQAYVDTDNDGVRDAGEAPIPGTTVTLTGTDDSGAPVILTTTTDATGAYLFDRLRPGNYTVTETQPAGYLDGKDKVGSAGGTLGNDVVSAITLAAGTEATGYDFGELSNASVAGRVVEDDGTPIPGVTVALTGTDDLGNPVSLTTTTAGDGTWSFPNLRPGTYVVTETQPPGFGDGPDTPGSKGGTAQEPDKITGIVLGSGDQGVNYVFTEKRSSIAGVVYEDKNDNGVQDPGEPGIPGATVVLGGAAAKTVTTDANGNYLFDRLLAGDYTVTETQPAGYLDGKDKLGTSGGTLGNDVVSAITLPGGTAATGYDFGELKPAEIKGKVTEDDGTPIGGVTITLTGPVTATTTTNPDGTWSFPNLPPGSYTVTETQPPGFGDGPDVPGSAGGTVEGPDTIKDIVLTPGQAGVDYVFTETRSSIAGVVYEDKNDNGVQDAGEPGIPGATVVLGGAADKTITTDADGKYVFDRLLAGDYMVTETQPAGYLDGKDKAGTSGGTAGNDVVSAITLPGGTAATGYDFGELKPAGISGRVTEDDGTPIPGVTITLTGPVTVTTTTGPDGTWSIPNLPPGSYTVTETQPPGFGDGPDTPGSAGGTPQGPDTIKDIVLVPGQSGVDYVFTDTRSSITGVVYADTNDNGVQDPGEPGIPGATVVLSGAADKTVTTDANGRYVFDRLLSGDYTVTETQPAGYLDGKDKLGTSGGTLGNDVVSAITLPGGTAATGYDFGELKPAGISGKVTEDDGTPIPGVTITLTGPVTVTTTTGPDGTWSFPNLPPGSYTVTETQPPGFGDGPDTPGSAGGTTEGPDTIKDIVLTPGQDGVDYLFTETRSSIAGVVYVDTNDNGVQDPGEAGIPGVTVLLSGPESRTVITDADGKYLFDRLLAGDYTVTETQPADYTDGKDTPGSAGGTATEPDKITVPLPAGTAATAYNFGEIGAAITGTVWVDVDGDGVIDPGEPKRLPGTEVVLLDSDGKEVARTKTDEKGEYSFTGLAPGDYQVREIQPDGYGSTTPNDVPVTVPAGGTGRADFGEQRGSIGDFVWSDTDADGVQDEGEPGVPGVTVVLLDAGGWEVGRTTTDASGHYLFTDLPPGDYRAQFLLPTGQAFTTPGKGTSQTGSDADLVTGTTGAIPITIGVDGKISQRTDVDAGLVKAAPDLAVDLVVDKTTVRPGEPATYTGTVTNVGNTPVTGVEYRQQVPPGLRIDSATGAGWTCVVTGQEVVCTRPDVLLPGKSAPPVTVVTTAVQPGTSLVSTATTKPLDGQVEVRTDNNTDTVDLAVVGPPAPPPLAFTGGHADRLVPLGLLLIVAGFLLVIRRRRTA
jgi:uncharacterized repeat protein (TIGR01451 family)